MDGSSSNPKLRVLAPELLLGGQICACRACGSEYFSYLCSTPNHVGTLRELHHYHCSSCGAVFVGNMIESSDLATAYASYDMAAYYREIEHENGLKMAASAYDLGRLLQPDEAILDIGAGNGQFAEILHRAGFSNLYVHEIPGAAIPRAEGIAKNIYRDFDYASVPTGRFKAVTLLDVLEHVPQPQQLAHTCARALSVGALLYIHTPVVTRLDRIMHSLQKTPVLSRLGLLWQRGRTSIFHLENYTPRSLQLILERAGFSDIEIRVENELSWPIRMYVRVHLVQRLGLPQFFEYLLTPLFWPVLRSSFFNANKAIVTARKRS